jgi:hypothetical protein
MADIAKLKGWELKDAIERAVNGKGTERLEEVLREVGQAAQRAGYPISQSDIDMLIDYTGGRIKREAHRPKSSDPSMLAKNKPVLWLAVDYVKRYKRVQKKRYHRVKGVEKEAIEKAIVFIAKKHGGAPPDADVVAIEKAIEFIEKKVGYRLTTDRISHRLRRSGTKPKRRS